MGLGIKSLPKAKIWLFVILIAGFLNGLLHIILVPPWQHYDEPGHFEYAWLIANKPGLPQAGEYVQPMRREIAASMIEHGFFTNMGFKPNLLSITEPVWIGISQTDDPPVYYLLAAIPLYLVRTSDLTFQLYLARFVSLGLFLLTLWGGYKITSELTNPGNSLRLLIPITAAMIPSFADIMTAVNNDVGAAAFFTLYLWSSLRILKYGITWKNSILLILLATICIFTKSTTFFVIPLTLIAITISSLHPSKRKYGWISAFILFLILLFIPLKFNGVLYWHDRTNRDLMERVSTEDAPDGQYSLEIKSSNSKSTSNIVQLIPDAELVYLRGKTITVGTWLWSSIPMQGRTPVLDDSTNLYYESVQAETTPKFFTYVVDVDAIANQLTLSLQNSSQKDNNTSLFFDGVILVEGDHSRDGLPSFLTTSGSQVELGSQRLTNFIRNASFEKSAPRLSSKVDELFANYLPDQLSLVLASIFDIDGFSKYYSSTAQHLFRSFWAVFGWGQVYLIGSKPYRILLIISLFAVIGDVIYLWRNQHRLSWNIFGFLSIALFGVWGMAATRGVSSVFSNIFIPAARYAYPVIIPTVFLFVVGWREVLNITGKRLSLPNLYQYAVYILFLLVLNGLSIYSIWLFYEAI